VIAVRFTDIDQLENFAADLAKVAKFAPEIIRKVVQKGALNIKTDARHRSSGIRHAPMYPYTITYDTTARGGLVQAEIGPDPTKQVGGGPFRTPGNLGAILEYGAPKSAPIPHLGPALDTERPKFERELEAVALRSLGGL
jgi:hypothetical protein